jgi:hypothetical protein
MNAIKNKASNPSAINKNAVALKAFFGISTKWKLTADQECTLLGVPDSTFYRWKKNYDGSLNKDTLERISYVLGIYKALRILLPNEEAANQWIHKANSAPLFGGKSALDKLMRGCVMDLADVRRYLDAERG